MRRSIILLSFGIFLINVAAQAQLPTWVTSPQDQYPTSKYITGVGISEDLAAAKKQAKAEIASQIQTTIKAEITDIEQEMQFEGATTARSDFTQKIQEITEVSISGVTYPESDERNGKFYILGVLDKQQYLRDIAAQLNTKFSSLNDLYSSIRDQLDGGNVLTALENYQTLTDQLNEFFGLRSIYNTISSVAYGQEPPYSLNSVWTDIITLIRSIQINPVGGEGQTAKPGQQLRQPVAVQVTYSKDGKTVPVSGMVLEFENSDGSQIDKKETGSNGQASVKPIAVSGNSPTRGTVSVTFASMPFASLRKNLRTKRTTIAYTIEQPTYSFRLEVTREGESLNSQFKRNLQQALSGMGYSIAGDAPVKLVAEVNITNSRQMSGFAGTQYMAEAGATLKLVNVRSGEVLGQTQLTGRGMDTGSMEKAENMAIDRIDVSRSKLSQFFANTSSQLQQIYGN